VLKETTNIKMGICRLTASEQYIVPALEKPPSKGGEGGGRGG